MDPLQSAVSSRVSSPDAAGVAPAAKPSTSRFGELVGELLAGANREQLEAEHQARELAAGRADVVDAMIAVSRADLSLRFVVTLRNRALEAYQEIMRLQV